MQGNRACRGWERGGGGRVVVVMVVVGRLNKGTGYSDEVVEGRL